LPGASWKEENVANQTIKLQNLKDYLRLTKPDDDDLLSDMIDDITDEVNDYLDVRIGPPVKQESCVLDGGKSFLKLPILNVANVTVMVDTDRAFNDSSDIVDPSVYTVIAPEGIIEINQMPSPGAWGLFGDYNVHGQYGQWGYQGLIQPAGRLIIIYGNKIVQATYDGGYDYTSLPGSLRRALIRQLAYNYKHMTDLGISSTTIAGVSQTKYSTDEWLPDVQRVLDNYKRLSLAP
jgi:hypothetical protein